MQKLIFLIYGLFCHVLFLAVFMYMACFVGNFLVPKTIDGAAQLPTTTALLINALLIAAFTVPHSIMARSKFKCWWTNYIAKPIERSTYVLASCILMILLIWLWQPIPGLIWDVKNPTARTIL
jgi:protein-S-isoprenylcysteine O-methyltransferase Ste14